MAGVAQVITGIEYDSWSNSSRTGLQLSQVSEYHSKYSILILRCGYIFWCGYKVINISKHFFLRNYFLH